MSLFPPLLIQTPTTPPSPMRRLADGLTLCGGLHKGDVPIRRKEMRGVFVQHLVFHLFARLPILEYLYSIILQLSRGRANQDLINIIFVSDTDI